MDPQSMKKFKELLIARPDRTDKHEARRLGDINRQTAAFLEQIAQAPPPVPCEEGDDEEVPDATLAEQDETGVGTIQMNLILGVLEEKDAKKDGVPNMDGVLLPTASGVEAMNRRDLQEAEQMMNVVGQLGMPQAKRPVPEGQEEQRQQRQQVRQQAPNYFAAPGQFGGVRGGKASVQAPRVQETGGQQFRSNHRDDDGDSSSSDSCDMVFPDSSDDEDAMPKR